MAIETIAQIKTYFETGDRPTEAQFVNLIDTLANGGAKVYKALLSQNAPVATTTDPTMVAGQIWTLEAYNAADAATIAALELVSGTLYAVGSKYRSATDQTLSVDAGTTFSYDGSPYVVSTDVNGNFAPFVNTTGETPTYSYVVPGRFSLTSPNNLYLLGKTTSTIGQRSSNTWKNVIDTPTTSLADINTLINGTRSDGMLYYSLIEIEVYP